MEGARLLGARVIPIPTPVRAGSGSPGASCSRQGRCACGWSPPSASQPLVEAPPGLRHVVGFTPQLSMYSGFRSGCSRQRRHLLSNGTTAAARIDGRELADLLVMSGLTGRRDLKAAILAQPRQPLAHEALKTGLILQSLRPPDAITLQKAVQCRTATGFKIGFVPHGASLSAIAPSCKRVNRTIQGSKYHLPLMPPDSEPCFMSLFQRLPLAFLRQFDPETAHELAIRALSLGLTPFTAPDIPQLSTRTLDLRFPNPIGLAAGFDKDGKAIRPLARLGFGFIEAGTVTPRPQDGNPLPRLFRLTEDRAIINRMGFNGQGIDRFCKRLARLHRPRPNGGRHGIGRTPLGANIGINKVGADPLRDYPELVARVSPYVDYVTINLSSPNTPGLRDLQTPEFLGEMLDAVFARNSMAPKILIKLAPDLPLDRVDAVVEAAVSHKADGLILTNTTISRPEGLQSSHARESGGLSGRPVRPLALTMLRHIAPIARGRLAIIACGGIETGEDILERLIAGADLVQIYSAFIFEGPALIPRLKRELLEAMRQYGFETVDDIRSARTYP